MRKHLTAGMAIALLAGPAIAADLPVKAPPLVPVPVFNWTGCYVGGNGGWKEGRFKETDSAPGTTIDLGPSRINTISVLPGMLAPNDVTDNSYAAGGQIGCRWQTRDRLVLGVEGDFDGTNLNATQQTSPLQVVAETGTSTTIEVLNPLIAQEPSFRIRARWESSLRGNIGYAFDRLLVYATAGIAFTRVTKDATFFAARAIEVYTDGGEGGGPNIFHPGSSGSDSHILTGLTVGGGLAYALDDHWDIGLEYRYTHYDHTNFHLGMPSICQSITTPTSCASVPVTGSVGLNTNEVLAKLNYRFFTTGP